MHGRLSLLLAVSVLLVAAGCTSSDAPDAQGFYAEISTVVEQDAQPPRWQIAVGSRDTTETRARWWYVDAEHYRWEIESRDPPLEAGTVTTVANGEDVWTYDSRLGTYQRLEPIPRSARMFPSPAGFSTLIGPANASDVEELANWYRETGTEVTLRGDEQSSIRVIEYRPVWRSSSGTATAPSPGGDERRAEPPPGAPTPGAGEQSGGVGRIWVDTNLMFVMRHEIDGGEGHQSALFEVTTLEHGIAIDGDLLRFEPPTRAREVESMTAAECSGSSGPLGGPGFSAPAGFLRPSYAPEGFVGGSAGAQSGPGCELVGAWSLLSATGGAGYALLQQRVRVDVPDALRAGEPVDVDGRDGYRQSEGAIERLVWRDGELVAMLESDTLPFEELRRIAESAERVTADTPPFTPTPVATPSPGSSLAPTDLDQIRSQSGFAVFVPAYVPAGLTPRIADRGASSSSSVHIDYVDPDGVDRLTVVSCPFRCAPFGGGEPIALGGDVTAYFVEGELYLDPARETRGAALWSEQDGAYLVVSSREFGRDELVRVAASVSSTAELVGASAAGATLPPGPPE